MIQGNIDTGGGREVILEIDIGGVIVDHLITIVIISYIYIRST